jgi:signal transduction histidine kinase
MLSVTIAISVTVSLFSYAYFLSVSEQINETMTDELRRQARAEAFHVGKLLENNIAIVVGHTRTMAASPLVIESDLERAYIAIDNRQRITSDLTDRYFWLDSEGKTTWSSAFTNVTERELYQGFDVSDRPYFVNPAQTYQPYFSPVVMSPVDGSQRVFFSYPVLQESEAGQRSFDGVIVASIRADTLGENVGRQISAEIESSVGLIDPNGVIVYTSNSSLVGENIFGDRVQSLLRPALSSQEALSEFNEFMRNSLQGSNDSRDFSAAGGASSTITYLPIHVNIDPGSSTDEGSAYHFLTLYVTAPHNISGKVNPLVGQVRDFSLSVIVAVSAVTIIVAYIVFLWNRRLEQVVDERTASLKEANEQLKVRDKMQAEFINIAAHELRTPVQPIKGVAEMARLLSQQRDGQNIDSPKVELDKEEVDMLYRNASRLEKLTENILDVTRIESQTLRLKKEKFDLSEKIRQAVYDAQRQYNTSASRKVSITYEAQTEPITVEADLTRIFEVLSNLLGNASKFTEAGTITVKSEITLDGMVVVSITDTGSGIDEVMVPRLFTKFATASESGTGLGLYISRKIIEAHGGTMWANNNENGIGATFFFSMPITLDQHQRAELANAQVRTDREHVRN